MKRITGSFDVKKVHRFNVVMSPDAKVWYINIKCKVSKFNPDTFRAYMNFYSNADDQDNYLMVRYFQRAPGQCSMKVIFNNPYKNYEITTNEPDWTVTTVATPNTENIVDIVFALDYEKLVAIAGFDNSNLLNNCLMDFGFQGEGTKWPQRAAERLNDKWRLVGFGTCTTFEEARKCNIHDMTNFVFGSTNCCSGTITEIYYGDIKEYCCSNPGKCVNEDYLCNRKPLTYRYEHGPYTPHGLAGDDWGLYEHFANGPKTKKDITIFMLILFFIIIIVYLFCYFNSSPDETDEVIQPSPISV